METIEPCMLCGSRAAQPFMRGRDLLLDKAGDFTLARCAACGLVTLTPRPDAAELERHYPQDYVAYPIAIPDEPSWLRRLDRAYGLHKRCREVIRRAGKTGRLLDVGCATGVFLDGMRQRGWQVVGVEPVHRAAQYARERFGLQVVEDMLEGTHFDAASFDAVTLWDVLEHVPAPRDTLNEISRLLKPGGWLVMSLPNPEAWEAGWFGRYWAGWDIPRHFHIFTAAHLRRLLSETGLELVDVSHFTGRHGILALSLDFWINAKQIKGARQRWLRALIRSIPARAATYPFYAVADRLNKSSIMTIFAQKKRGGYG